MEILCFFAGTAFACFRHPYPLFFLWICLFFRWRLSLIIWFFSAVIWFYFHQFNVNDVGMPTGHIISRAVLQGQVVSIPNQTNRKVQFQFLAQQLNGNPIKALLLITCFEHCPLIKAGQYWQMIATLKKAVNLRNPGGFDYVQWLSARHIVWTGYIKDHSLRLLNDSQRYSLLVLREYLASCLAKLDQNEKTLGILQALTLGVTGHIDNDQWTLFRRTGIIHLMIISGAHIGLVAGLTYRLCKWLWCRIGRLSLHCPAPKAASIAAIIIALIYALLAGFAVPAQRAFIGCIFMSLRHISNSYFSGWQAWRYALLAVLIFEPHSVLLPGFYLSFLAVAILVLTNQRIQINPVFKTLSLQIGCLLGLMPLSLFWFSYGAVNGVAANLLAIPWVSYIIVPLALLITLLSPWAVIPWLVSIVKAAIVALLAYLNWIDYFSFINISYSFQQLLQPLALMIAMFVIVFMSIAELLPLAILLMIMAFFPYYETVNLGDAIIDILDVGQGLSVIVRTANHTLVYDTGVKFYRGGDMAKLAIIPYLDRLKIKKLDAVIISHPDLDHLGGLKSLETTYSIGQLIVDDPMFYKRGFSCHDYPAWTWDGVNFKFFAITQKMNSKNNKSCILQIITKAGRMLLTGDIEKIAEQYLIQKYSHSLQSTAMLIPHHGSKTSSSQEFIAQIAPQYAIASFGLDNRYHFPHKEAMVHYQQKKVKVFNTSDCGSVRVILPQQGNIQPQCLIKKNFFD
ncbi:MAG: DNA internalization-related competence protein ComEC/Rec2 [Legionella sp.]